MDQLSEAQLRDAKADSELAAISGYDPESVVKIPMTPDLRAAIDQLRLTKSVSETEAGNIQRLKELEEEKDKKADAQRDAPNDPYDMVEPTEEYLQETHSFGGMSMTGKQWGHVAKYAKENRELILQQWEEEGVDPAKAQDALRAVEIMRRGPQNAEEKSFMERTGADHDTKSLVDGLSVQAGMTPEHAPDKAPVDAAPKTLDKNYQVSMAL